MRKFLLLCLVGIILFNKNISSQTPEICYSQGIDLGTLMDAISYDQFVLWSGIVIYNSAGESLFEVLANNGNVNLLNLNLTQITDKDLQLTMAQMLKAGGISSPADGTVYELWVQVTGSGTTGAWQRTWTQKYVFRSANPGTIGLSTADVCYGSTTNPIISITDTSNYPSGQRPSVNWYYSNGNIIPGAGNGMTPVLGALTSTISLYRTITDGSICPSQNSNTVTLTVYPELSQGTIGQTTQTICYGASASTLSFTTPPSGGSGSYSYQWQWTNNSDGSGMQNCSLGSSTTFSPGSLTSTTYYQSTVKDNAGCTSAASSSNLAEISVLPALGTITIPSPQPSVCYGDVPSPLTCQAPGGGNGSYTYQWLCLNNSTFINVGDATGLTYTPPALKASTEYKISATSCGQTTTSEPVTINVYGELSPGTVYCNVAEGQAICYGQSPSLTASLPVGGSGQFTYSWETSPDNMSWTPAGSTNQSSFDPGALYATTWFRQVQTDASCGTVYSNPVKVTVLPAVSAGTIEDKGTTICYNTSPGTLLFSSVPSGGSGSYSYQWQSSDDNLGNDFQPCTGEGNNSVSFTPEPITSNTYYRCLITDNTCRTAAYENIVTNSVKVTVESQLSEGTQTSQQQTICYNSIPAEMSVSNPSGGEGGSTYTYIWQSSTDNIAFDNIPNSSSFTFTPQNTLTQTTYFRRSVTSGSCGTAYSPSIEVIVMPELTAPVLAGDQSICYNSAPDQPVYIGTDPAGGTGSYTYRWQVSTNGGESYTDLPDELTSYQPGVLIQTSLYEVTATSGSCGSVTSNYATITVFAPLQEAVISANQSVCYNSVPLPLKGDNAKGGDGIYSYQWQTAGSNLNWQNIQGATSETFAPGILNTDTFFRRSVTSLQCGTAYSNSVNITAGSPVNAGVISPSQTICRGSNASVITGTSPTGGSGNYLFQWQISTDSVTFINISNTNNSSLEPGIISTVTYFRRIVNTSCGNDTTNTVSVKILPPLDGGYINGSQSICYDMTPSVLSGTAAKGEDVKISYQWQYSEDSISWVNILLDSSGPTYAPDSLQVTTWFRRVATSITCNTQNASNTVMVRVSPEETPGSVSSNQNVCYNTKPATITGTPASGGTGSPLYSWEDSRDGITWTAIDFFADSLGYSPGYLTDTTAFRRKVSMAGCRDMYTNSVIITIRAPVAEPHVITDSSYCRNSEVKLNETSGSENLILWYKADNILVYEGLTYTVDTFKGITKLVVQALRPSDNCKSDSVTVILNPDPVHAGFAVASSDTQVLIGTGINFINKSTNAVSYVWDFFDGDPSFAVNPWHFYNAVGKYNIRLVAISKNNCTDTAFAANYIDAVVSQGTDGYQTDILNTEDNKIRIYPNPAADFLKIFSEGNNMQEINIFDMQGKNLISKDITGIDNISVNVENLNPGLYILKIQTSDGMQIFKIVKL